MGYYKELHQNDCSIVLCGAAGQGIQTIEFILVRILKLSGYHVFATKEYMSRIRGGSNSTEIRVSSRRVSAHINRIDILVPLDKKGIPHLEKRISPDTVILGEREKLDTQHAIIDIPYIKIATEIGSPIYANMVAIGVIAGILQCDQEIIDTYLTDFFKKKGEDIIEKNKQALQKGLEMGEDLLHAGGIKIAIEKSNQTEKDTIINGAEALGLGALAGGCNFVSAYPMSPSTGVLVFLSYYAKEFGIIVEQAEDEISAVNMALGAWYAGARALVSTSGGGFALMEEGVSLSGMLEIPLVIHLAQRPGPATGLPTRTEQGDLEFVLYSGHGEFPRIIFAPGTIEDVFYITQKAFNLAAKYHIPVFILTDQYMMDSYYNFPLLPLSPLTIENHIHETQKDYKRYQLTENGISPRGIPGFGNGLVAVDSDEHDEEGHITENHEIRIKMVDKRLKKMEYIRKDALPPELIGNKEYNTLIICWGSTLGIVKEAVEKLDNNSIALLYFKQVYPLHEDTLDLLKKARKRIVIENNATSQFSRVLKVQTGIEMTDFILKYDGLPFAVEEIVEQLNACGV